MEDEYSDTEVKATQKGRVPKAALEGKKIKKEKREESKRQSRAKSVLVYEDSSEDEESEKEINLSDYEDTYQSISKPKSKPQILDEDSKSITYKKYKKVKEYQRMQDKKIDELESKLKTLSEAFETKPKRKPRTTKKKEAVEITVKAETPKVEEKPKKDLSNTEKKILRELAIKT